MCASSWRPDSSRCVPNQLRACGAHLPNIGEVPIGEGGLVLDIVEENREFQIDKLRIRLLITNLLNNACRHGESNPITVRLNYKGENALLEVIDNGEGIAEIR